MDIRLRARLSAYSKVVDSNCPDPDKTVAGHVLGVDQEGTYSFLPRVSEKEIETLFPSDNSTENTELD